jgi:hypothetical protein
MADVDKFGFNYGNILQPCNPKRHQNSLKDQNKTNNNYVTN